MFALFTARIEPFFIQTILDSYPVAESCSVESLGIDKGVVFKGRGFRGWGYFQARQQ
jgi:hypothetical protein